MAVSKKTDLPRNCCKRHNMISTVSISPSAPLSSTKTSVNVPYVAVPRHGDIHNHVYDLPSPSVFFRTFFCPCPRMASPSSAAPKQSDLVSLQALQVLFLMFFGLSLEHEGSNITHRPHSVRAKWRWNKSGLTIRILFITFLCAVVWVVFVRFIYSCDQKAGMWHFSCFCAVHNFRFFYEYLLQLHGAMDYFNMFGSQVGARILERLRMVFHNLSSVLSSSSNSFLWSMRTSCHSSPQAERRLETASNKYNFFAVLNTPPPFRRS